MVLCPMTGIESTAVGAFVETGSRYETPQINGISHFLEHMVFKGTKKFPTPKDTSYLEGLGAIQNAWTDVDATAYWCKIPSDRWQEGLELVKELVLYPRIPAKDLEIERGVIIEEINRKEDRPDEISAELLMKIMYPGNSLGMTILGTTEVIKGISRADFLNYHQSQYVAGRIVVAVAGNISAYNSQLLSKIEEYFGGLPKNRGGDFQPVNPAWSKPAIEIYRKDLAAQVHLNMGFPGLTVSDPRRFALAILTAYLGHGLSSRLFTELREKRGLCYAITADEARLTDTGVWSIYAGLNIEKLEEAVKAIQEELHRVKEVFLTEEELLAAKEKNRGPILFSAENPVNVMNFYAKQVLDRPEEIMTYDQVIDRLLQIDSKQVQKVAQDLFVSEKINLSLVGPVEERRQTELVKLLRV